MIAVRLCGFEVLAVGSLEPDETDVETCDTTAGGFELADPELAERDHDVYLGMVADGVHPSGIVVPGAGGHETIAAFVLPQFTAEFGTESV